MKRMPARNQTQLLLEKRLLPKSRLQGDVVLVRVDEDRKRRLLLVALHLLLLPFGRVLADPCGSAAGGSEGMSKVRSGRTDDPNMRTCRRFALMDTLAPA
jgi:hypothetical protein